MKTFVTVLSALAIMGTVSVASASPSSDDEFGSRSWWEAQSNKGR